jgi:putative hydrolase of the HAD superfamily
MEIDALVFDFDGLILDTEWLEDVLLGRFSAVVTRDDVASVKPAPDLYLAATAALGASPRRSVAFEDSSHGCTSAVAAGLRCVVVPNRMTRPQDFPHADRVVETLADVDLAGLQGLVSGAKRDSSAERTEP